MGNKDCIQGKQNDFLMIMIILSILFFYFSATPLGMKIYSILA